MHPIPLPLPPRAPMKYFLYSPLHSILIQACTGKTILARQMVATLQALVKEMDITTSTGIAGKQFEFRSKTLHRYIEAAVWCLCHYVDKYTNSKCEKGI